MSNNLEQLTALKISKLQEQKELSDKMSAMLHHKMIPNQTLNNKNLMAAVAVSKKPGFFDYHQCPDDIKEIEREKTLNKLARQVGKLNNELESITSEINLANVEAKAAIASSNKKLMNNPEKAGMSSIAQWIESYGNATVDMEATKDQFTSFKPASKIYGGTGHHRSFKSSAMTMTKGRLV
jgi:hypothetical protein